MLPARHVPCSSLCVSESNVPDLKILRELEAKLVSAAAELLAHSGGLGAFLPIPGHMPIRCVVVGDLRQIRMMVAPPVAPGAFDDMA